MEPLYLFLTCILLIASVDSAPQVPYDYVPIGRENRRDGNDGHPHDVNLNYERLFPARRKFIDSPAIHIDPDLDFFKNGKSVGKISYVASA